MHFNLPTSLTLARVVAVALICAVFYLPITTSTKNWAATLIFAFAGWTDWADGYFARRLKQTSAFGAFLDPVADKFLVCASLLILVELGRAPALIALIIIGREIAISALREWMAQIGASSSVAVHSIGKLKTTAQMIAIAFLLFDAPIATPIGSLNTHAWGAALLIIAAVLTLISMVFYMQKAWPEIRRHPRA